MANPTPTARSTPKGTKLREGHGAKITFASRPNVAFWEQSLKPSGIDGGDAIETTSMHNVKVKTKAPRTLYEVTDTSTTVEYDPNVVNEIKAMINVEDTITVTWPDGGTLCYFGYLQKFEPNELKTGELPTATINIVATNADPSTGTEQVPMWADTHGT